MSRFAVLRDGSDDESGPDGMVHLTPQYTLQQIMSYQSACSTLAPPPELANYENIFIADSQPTESSVFRPPQSEINSVPFAKPTRAQAAAPRRIQSAAPSPQRQHQKEPRKKTPTSRTESSASLPRTPTDAVMWLYKDPTGAVFGPFSGEKMRDWMNKRFIDSTLFVKVMGSAAPFVPIKIAFPDLGRAFQDVSCQKFGPILEHQQELSTLFSFSLDDAEDDRAWEAMEKT